MGGDSYSKFFLFILDNLSKRKKGDNNEPVKFIQTFIKVIKKCFVLKCKIFLFQAFFQGRR